MDSTEASEEGVNNNNKKRKPSRVGKAAAAATAAAIAVDKSPDEREEAEAAASAIADSDVRSPSNNFRRYSVPEESFNKSMTLDSETSDSEDSEDEDAQKFTRMKMIDFYDSKQFEDLDVTAEVKELFQNISRYTPQRIELQYKLAPFIPDYIPAVGDIDAFLKIPRPDGLADRLGLAVLDEPASEQSEPAVLQLQLRSRDRGSARDASKAPAVVKRLEDAPRQTRLIDKWIEDMGQLHRSRAQPPAVQLKNRFPDLDQLMRPWPPRIEAKLWRMGKQPPGLLGLDCDLLKLIDVICALLDIPVYGDQRIESLHTLFALYTEVHNVDIQTIHS